MIELKEKFSEKRRKPGLVEFMFRNGDHGIVDLILYPDIRCASISLHRKKGQRRRDPDPFVSVKIGLGFSQVVSIGGGNIEVIAISVKQSILCRSQGGFDHSGISDPGMSSVVAQRHRVQLMHLFQSKKHRNLLGEALKKVSIFGVNLLSSFLEGKSLSLDGRNRRQPDFKVLKLSLHSGKFSFQLLKSIQKYLDWLFVVSCNHTYMLPESDSSSSRILNPAFTS